MGVINCRRKLPYWVYAAAAAVLVCAVAGGADMWGRVVWEDDFEDGNYTSNPTWTTFDSGAGASHAVQTYEGDYAFYHSAPYVGAYGTGWSAAYVDLVQGDQGIAGWLDVSGTQGDSWAALYMLRHSPSGIGFMGTGYALSVNHDDTGGLWAQLLQVDDTSVTDITDAQQISSTYDDVWVRFLATGTGTDTRLLGRAWLDGDPEPLGWMLNSDNPGSQSGITYYYDTGRGGLGVGTQSAEISPADAYFDDIEYGIPEPGTLALVLAGIGGLAVRRRLRK